MRLVWLAAVALLSLCRIQAFIISPSSPAVGQAQAILLLAFPSPFVLRVC